MSATDATEVCRRTTRPPIDSHGIATSPRAPPHVATSAQLPAMLTERPTHGNAFQPRCLVALPPFPRQVAVPTAGRKINEIIAEKEVRDPAPHVSQWQALSRKHAPFPR